MRTFQSHLALLTVTFFTLAVGAMVTCYPTGAHAKASLDTYSIIQPEVASSFSIGDTLGSYFGTIRIEMQDGSYVTPFGTDVVIESIGSGNVVQQASTNNKGRFYLNNLENGRYIFKIQHNKKTVYSDTLTITSSTAQNLGTRVVDIQRVQ